MLEDMPAVQTFQNRHLLAGFYDTYSGTGRSGTTNCTLVTGSTLESKEEQRLEKISHSLWDGLFKISPDHNDRDEINFSLSLHFFVLIHYLQ